MTTIVYRDGVLASESLITYGGTKMPAKFKKIYRLPKGALYGFTGSLELGEIMRRRLVHSTDDDNELSGWTDLDKENFEGILVQPDGDTYFFENRAWTKVKVPYVAMGSGKEHAYGALGCGASAKQACKVAALLDPGSGGKVYSVSIPWDKPISRVEQIYD